MKHVSEPQFRPERGKNLYVRVSGEGRAVWVNLGTRDMAVAMARVQSMRIEEAMRPIREYTHSIESRPFPEVWRTWISQVLSTQTRSGTQASLMRTADSLRPILDRPLGDISTADLRDALLTLARGGLAPSTVALRRAHLRWFFKWAHEEGLIGANPALALKPVRVERPEPRSLTDEEIAALRAVWGRESNVVVASAMELALETGLRLGNVVSLEWSEVDLARGWISIPAARMKGRRDFSAPLSARAVEILKACRVAVRGPVFPGVTRSSLDHAARRVFRKAGVVDGHFHLFRSTFVTGLARRGVAPEVAMRLSAHTDYRTVLRHYRAIDVEEMLRAVGRVGERSANGAETG